LRFSICDFRFGAFAQSECAGSSGQGFKPVVRESKIANLCRFLTCPRSSPVTELPDSRSLAGIRGQRILGSNPESALAKNPLIFAIFDSARSLKANAPVRVAKASSRSFADRRSQIFFQVEYGLVRRVSVESPFVVSPDRPQHFN